MAVKIPRPCRHPNCSGITVLRCGYCDKHRNTGWEDYQGGRTREQRGYGRDWDKKRRNILKRDNHLCQCCRRHGMAIPASDVDHIKPKKHGGTDDESNLEALCTTCHRRKTAQEQRKR